MQLCFVVGTAGAAILNLADLVSSRYYVAACAMLGAGANVLMLVASDGYSRPCITVSDRPFPRRRLSARDEDGGTCFAPSCLGHRVVVAP